MLLDESDGSDMQCYDRINIFFNHLKCLDNDLVIVDTSAGIGTVTTNILKEGDSVIIPQQSEPFRSSIYSPVPQKDSGHTEEGIGGECFWYFDDDGNSAST